MAGRGIAESLASLGIKGPHSVTILSTGGSALVLCLPFLFLFQYPFDLLIDMPPQN